MDFSIRLKDIYWKIWKVFENEFGYFHMGMQEQSHFAKFNYGSHTDTHKNTHQEMAR